MTNCLIIFIDSLPYSLVKKEKNLFINTLGEVSPVQPGVGYSINVYAELFAGLSPDEIGFFNKFTPKERVVRNRIEDSLFRVLDLSRIYPMLSRGLHIAYSKLMGEENLGNIPFRYLKYFKRKQPMGVFSTDKTPTIFNRFGLEISLSPNYSEGVGLNDKKAFDCAIKKMGNGRNHFVMFGDLDGIAHKFGLKSSRYSEHILSLDELCESIIHEFKKINGKNSRIILFSDHGMAEVKEGITLDIEKKFGKMDLKSYIYFLDSTFLRIWLKDKSLESDMYAYLNSLKCGSVLSNEMRARYGVVDTAFGDFIFLLDEGKVFFPGFMGGRLVKSMHGYKPELESQAGIFIDSSNEKGRETPKNSKGVYEYLVNTLES